MERQPAPATLKFMEEQRAANQSIASTLARIDERTENIVKLVETHHEENKEGHEKIINRQDYTNGRVKRLELWKYFLMGCWAVITIIVLPMIGYFVWKVNDEMTKLNQNIEGKITRAIDYNNSKFFEVDN